MKQLIVLLSIIIYFGQNVFALERIEIPQSSFHRDDVKKVVIDKTLNLMWQDDESVAKVTKNWQEAHDYCQQLSYLEFHNWRLPSIEELVSLTDESKFSPAINNNFKNVANERYWSNDSFHRSEALRVGFQFGGDFPNDKSIASYVRCVRDNELTSGTPTIVQSNQPYENPIITFQNNPTYETALTIARDYYTKQNFVDAVAWAKKANQLNRESEEAWLLYTKSYYALGQKNDAIGILQLYMNYRNSKTVSELLHTWKESTQNLASEFVSAK